MKYIIFEQGAYDDFCDWGIYDKARYLNIHDLIKACLREPFKGMGKPEPLNPEYAVGFLLRPEIAAAASASLCFLSSE